MVKKSRKNRAALRDRKRKFSLLPEECGIECRSVALVVNKSLNYGFVLRLLPCFRYEDEE